MGTKRMETVGYRKVGIALTAALSCFLLYVLACVFSSPSWSPDSSRIALLVSSGGLEEPNEFGIFTYDVRTDTHILLDRADSNTVFSSPAWSPDGKWIAYFRFHPVPARETGSPAPGDVTPEPNQTAQSRQAAPSKADAVEPFREKNQMLPPVLFEALRKRTEGKDVETLRAELVIVTPDGGDRRTLQTLLWPASDDDGSVLLLLKPEWSKDSKRLFYLRQVGEIFYVVGLDLATRQTSAYMTGSGTLAISPDGDWIASLLKTDAEHGLLSLARTDGSIQKHFRFDAEMGDNSASPAGIVQLSWSADAKYVLVSLGELFLIDATTGQVRKHDDPQTAEVAFGVFSPQGERLYYLAELKVTDPNVTARPTALCSHDLTSGETQTVLALSDIPDYNGVGKFSISPDGKIVALWCSVERPEAKEEPLLVLWDGQARKLIKTGAWLRKPAQSEDSRR